MKYEIIIKENGKEINSFNTNSFFLIFDEKEKVTAAVELHDAGVSDIVSMIEATRNMIDNLIEEKPAVAFFMALSKAFEEKGANNED